MKKLMIQGLLIFALPLSAAASSAGITSQGRALWTNGAGLSVSSRTGFVSPYQVGKVPNLGGNAFSGANLGHLRLSPRAAALDTNRSMRNGRLEIHGVGVDIALPVPEPGTLTLLGMGLLAMATAVRRKLNLGTTARS